MNALATTSGQPLGTNNRFTNVTMFALGIAAIGATFTGADALYHVAFAQTIVFTQMIAKATDFFYEGRALILIVCAIAIIATMVAALAGRFPIQRSIVVGAAILVIALASSVMSYFATPTGQTTAPSAAPTLSDSDVGG